MKKKLQEHNPNKKSSKQKPSIVDEKTYEAPKIIVEFVGKDALKLLLTHAPEELVDRISDDIINANGIDTFTEKAVNCFVKKNNSLREEACLAEVQEVLQKHGCKLDHSTTISILTI